MNKADNQKNNIINEQYIRKIINEIKSEWEFAKQNRSAELKIKDFYSDYQDLITSKIKDITFKFMKEHPILGECTDTHSYFRKPLYRYLDPYEPQFTKALTCFLRTNQLICKTFIESIFQLLNLQKKELPDNGYECKCEVITRDIKDKKRQRKRIDNVIIWENKALCIEVKFDAKIDNNDLIAYEAQMKEICKKGHYDIYYIAISIDNIQADINQKGNRKWKNILWCDLLKLWEKNIHNLGCTYKENEDMIRYRTSLWYKVLRKEEI